MTVTTLFVIVLSLIGGQLLVRGADALYQWRRLRRLRRHVKQVRDTWSGR